MAIRVAVCDDLPYIRDYFSEIIASQEDMELVGTAEDGKSIVKLASEKKPDVVLMDIQMESELAGVEATKKIKEILPDTRVVAITVHEEEEYIIQAYLAGATDYILKTEYTKEEICQSIRNVYANNVSMRPRVAKAVLTEFTNMHVRNVSLLYFVNVLTSLTATEMEILKDLYFGKARADIAKDRYIEPDTVKFHVHNILRKLNY